MGRLRGDHLSPGVGTSLNNTVRPFLRQTNKWKKMHHCWVASLRGIISFFSGSIWGMSVMSISWVPIWLLLPTHHWFYLWWQRWQYIHIVSWSQNNDTILLLNLSSLGCADDLSNSAQAHRGNFTSTIVKAVQSLWTCRRSTSISRTWYPELSKQYEY